MGSVPKLIDTFSGLFDNFLSNRTQFEYGKSGQTRHFAIDFLSWITALVPLYWLLHVVLTHAWTECKVSLGVPLKTPCLICRSQFFTFRARCFQTLNCRAGEQGQVHQDQSSWGSFQRHGGDEDKFKVVRLEVKVTLAVCLWLLAGVICICTRKLSYKKVLVMDEIGCWMIEEITKYKTSEFTTISYHASCHTLNLFKRYVNYIILIITSLLYMYLGMELAGGGQWFQNPKRWSSGVLALHLPCPSPLQLFFHN